MYGLSVLIVVIVVGIVVGNIFYSWLVLSSVVGVGFFKYWLLCVGIVLYGLCLIF